MIVILMSLSARRVQAAESYTQAFQNKTLTLSGKSVEANMYFTKMDYWHVKKATFNFNFQISQLASRQTSDITVSLNGVAFYSFRPKKTLGIQSEQIKVPLNLLSGENELRVKGQILDEDPKDHTSALAQTPANWLTIEDGSNLNFDYDLKEADTTLASFYAHFSGQDTVTDQRSKILTADQPSGPELTASMIALTGASRVITTENDRIQVEQMHKLSGLRKKYIMIIALYQDLHKTVRSRITSRELNGQAVIKAYNDRYNHYLVVTARTGSLLKKAARFVANTELMQETNKSEEHVSSQTATFSSTLHDQNGVHVLTPLADQVSGEGHHEMSYLISLPSDLSNADGSQIHLKLEYSRNLDFSRSLVTVAVNNSLVGSARLKDVEADHDRLDLTLPKGVSLGSSFLVRVSFDLISKGQSTSDDSASPWAQVDPRSKIDVRSQRGNDLLWTNYPALFIKDQTYDHLAVVVPKHMTDVEMSALTNVFNLVGSFVRNNTGQITFYTHQPSRNVLANQNVIVLGTPEDDAFIKKLNSKLYFRYDSAYKGFLSNEKLSLEKDYGETIGTAQLLRSPYNKKRGMLVVTGPTDEALYLASTQIEMQKVIQQYNGDAIVVDPNNVHYGYRFKKNKAIDQDLAVKRQFDQKSQLLLYLGFAFLAIVLIGVSLFLVVRKQGTLRHEGRHSHD